MGRTRDVFEVAASKADSRNESDSECLTKVSFLTLLKMQELEQGKFAKWEGKVSDVHNFISSSSAHTLRFCDLTPYKCSNSRHQILFELDSVTLRSHRSNTPFNIKH